MNKSELLYHYFSNSLTKDQELLFDKLLKEDEEFKKQFEFESNLKRVVKEKRHKELKSKLNQFETKAKIEKTDKKPSFSYLKIAASIIILITAGWFGYQNFFSINYENLYSENYNSYPNTVYSITRSDSTNSPEREAFVAYEAANYQLAIEKFDKAKSKDYFNFYKAQSYLNIKQYEKAKHLLETVIKTDEEFVAESHWYIALIYIKEENKTKAIEYLNQLVEKYKYKTEEAKLLIKALD
ncbi:tetratricopeptide repeat protein [uncultured Winogradskyella sp.]|uniref:tetratricopeptide repeat protein n=1 Tax=uncultured Winogradskyella sp. TaxID=395353 RepID=UPI00262E5E8F|nr:tetratricopeptide repeat protein [uncultured Winogradskyella sp.]